VNKEPAALVAKTAAVAKQRVPYPISRKNGRRLVELEIVERVRLVRSYVAEVWRELGNADPVVVAGAFRHAGPNHVALGGLIFRKRVIYEQMKVAAFPRGVRRVANGKVRERPKWRGGDRRDVCVAPTREVVP
jgi:hypothetical protein